MDRQARPAGPAGVYVRISSDVAGERLGVARQEQDCRKLAERRALAVAEVYCDNDVSAYSGKPRPAYVRMLADIAEGRIGTVIAWHADRLHRSPLELEGFIALVETTGCEVVTVQSGPIDLTTSNGRMSARIVGAVARGESEHKSERIKAKLKQNAEQGKHHGGTRPFGWEDDRRTLRPDEAAAVWLAADMLLAGNSVKAIARTLNASGVPPAGTRDRPGTEWRDSSVRGMLLRCRNAGLRRDQGQTTTVPGKWEPILDRDTWERVRVVLTDPSRRTTPGAAGRKYLLSAGIGRCGVCGGPLAVGKGKPYKGRAEPIYRCHTPAACVSRNMAAVDGLVTGLVLARLARPDAADLLRPRQESASAVKAREDVDRLRSRLDVAAADYADGAITAEQLRTITARVRAQVDSAERLIPPPVAVVAPLGQLVGAVDMAGVWAGLDVSVRRQVVDVLLSVVVNKTRHGPGFDPASVEIAWKGVS